MITLIRHASIMLCTLLISQGVLAHAEHDKARFVASNGLDCGQCNNRFRPCQTVSYAAQQAAKGDKILVAQGQYTIQSEQDLFYFSGELVPVFGGFDLIDQYQNQNPDTFVTTVVGVPEEYAEPLAKRGFHVIRDSKAQPQVKLAAKGKPFSALSMMQNKQSAASCNAGKSQGFSCQNMSLLAHLPLSEFPGKPSAANDIWGFIDLNTAKEYAIIGLNNAIAVVEVSEAENPQIVGSVSGQATSWRDIKVWQFFDQSLNRWRTYAYASADNVSEGVTIIDLSGLPSQISLVNRQTLDASAHNVYISNVDYGLNIALPGTEPLLHVTGSNRSFGAFRSYSLSNPEQLNLVYQPGGVTRNDYTHDASSVLINDSRAQSDCVNATAAGCNVVLDFNEKTLRIWDHSKQDNSVELSAKSYPLAEYTHSGWWTEDKQFVIVHDELDEQRAGLNTTLNIFDISSLTNPLLVGTWTGPTRAIDHNGFVRGNRYFMSNYERGVTVLDITQPAAPQEIGFFDTYPPSDNTAFNGAWGVYPFLPSGIILVSDINSGLYVIRDETLTSSDNALSLSQANLSLEEGQNASIQVLRQGSDSVTVAYELLPGSASDQDFVLANGELSWSANDSSTKTIPLTISVDTDDEADEVFFVRLVNPQNGAALGSPNVATISIKGKQQTGKVSFIDQQITVKETDGQISIDLSRSGGSAGVLTVTYELNAGTASIEDDLNASAGTLVWQDNDSANKTIVLPLINDTLNEGDEQFTLTLQSADPQWLGNNSEVNIIILDDEANQAPVANAGQDQQVNTRQVTQLQGSGSDPEGREVQFLWQQTSGTAVTLNNASSAQLSFTAPTVASTLVFSLTVSDDFGVSNSDSVQISVIANQTPSTSNSGSGGGSVSVWWLLALSGIVLVRQTKQSSKSCSKP